MAIVNITLQNDDILDTKIAGVSVYIYTTTAVFVTSGVTNLNGIVTFSLPDASYDILFFKYTLSVIQPQRIIVDSLLTNNFLIIGHIKDMPESLNPDLCRVSGYIYGPDGKPRKEIEVRFNQKRKNEITSNNEILNIPIAFHSDERGYFQFDLYRGMKFESFIEGYEYRLETNIPNHPSVELFRLLFPLPILLEHPGTVNLPLNGGPVSYPYTVYYNDKNTGKLSNDWAKINRVNSVSSIASVTFSDTHIIITPYEIGSTTLTFSRQIDPEYIWRDPDPFVADQLSINVS